MKVPPKRKGNERHLYGRVHVAVASMKVPPKRKGNTDEDRVTVYLAGLNESPSEKEGKWSSCRPQPPHHTGLNESPSEKEGKFARMGRAFNTSLVPQ